MRRRILTSPFSLGFAALVGAIGTTAAMADTGALQGPPIGNNRYVASIADQAGIPDSDDFVQDLLAGEAITVVVKALPDGGTTPLRPLLVLIDPDGVERNAGILTNADLTQSGAKKLILDKSGRWSARVSGRSGTQGPYSIQFNVKKRQDAVARNQLLGNDLPFSRTHVVSAFEGARFDAVLTWDPRALPVEFRSLDDPSGEPVLVADPENEGGTIEAFELQRAVRNRVSLSGITLSEGHGEYTTRVRVATADARYSLKIRVTPPTRPVARATAALTTLEPLLVARSGPIGGDVGVTTTFSGSNFSTNPVPTVFFGDVQATGVTVSIDGTMITMPAPPQPPSVEVVNVTVINPDRQTTCRANYFAYVPPPVITNIIDPVTLADVRAGSTLGGRTLLVIGNNLSSTQILGLGGTTSGITPTSKTQATFVLPPGPVGTVDVTLTDIFARTTTAPFQFSYKIAPSFASSPFTPGAIPANAANVVTIDGSGFEASDQWFFNNVTVPFTLVNSGRVSIALGPLAIGSYPFHVIDTAATRVNAPVLLDAKFPPTISFVNYLSGPFTMPNEIPLLGGAVIEVVGTNFAPSDTVTFGGAVITTITNRTTTAFRFTAPPHAEGFVNLLVTDGANQTATLSNAGRHMGYVSAAGTFTPVGSSTDDFGAGRAAAGDLDGDGRADDLVITSALGAGQPGTRATFTRILIGDNTTGLLNDTTATRFPGARQDPDGADVYDGTAVAIGDLDRALGNDIVLAGVGATDANVNYAPDVRLFRNLGSGLFSFDADNGSPSRYLAPLYAYNYIPYGLNYKYRVFGAQTPAGTASALALGDIDRDGGVDVVVGFDQYDQRYVNIDPSSTSVYSTSPYILSVSYPFVYARYFEYSAAVRVLENRFAATATGALNDVSKTNIPSAGNGKVKLSQPSALHARDIALGDLDRDGDLDAVVAWNDPDAVTAYGFFTKTTTGTSKQGGARVATQILRNSGGLLKNGGVLSSNVTSTAMPGGSSPEFWHADRVRLADLDGDSDLDMVLLTASSLEAWAGADTKTRSALRVLRNDSTTTSIRFVNVTGTAIPAAGSNDDWRGSGITIRDVNQDGIQDIIVSTTNSLATPNRSVRLFTGLAGLRFKLNADFLPAVDVDSGQAQELLICTDLGGVNRAPLVLIGESAPTVSPSGRRLRAHEWKR